MTLIIPVREGAVMRKGVWLLGGYAVLATAGAAYWALRPPEVVERVVEKRVEVSAPSAPPSRTELAIGAAADPKTPYMERVAALAGLPAQATQREVARLVELSETRNQPAPIRNDAVVALARIGKPLPGYAPQLIGMWKDKNEDPEWRMYCLQHLETIYALDPANQALAEKTLIDAVGDPHPPFSGTAMLAITRLAEGKPELASVARALARDTLARAERGSADPGSAITALQVARTVKDPAVLGPARRMAADPQAPVMSRMSAIGVLGEMGQAADLPMLEKLSGDQEPESRIRRVAQYAGGKIRERLDGPSIARDS